MELRKAACRQTSSPRAALQRCAAEWWRPRMTKSPTVMAPFFLGSNCSSLTLSAGDTMRLLHQSLPVSIVTAFSQLPYQPCFRYSHWSAFPQGPFWCWVWEHSLPDARLCLRCESQSLSLASYAEWLCVSLLPCCAREAPVDLSSQNCEVLWLPTVHLGKRSRAGVLCVLQLK